MTAIEKLMEGIAWEESTTPPPSQPTKIPYATHEGVLTIGGAKMKCYRLSDGQTVIDAEDF